MLDKISKFINDINKTDDALAYVFFGTCAIIAIIAAIGGLFYSLCWTIHHFFIA